MFVIQKVSLNIVYTTRIKFCYTVSNNFNAMTISGYSWYMERQMYLLLDPMYVLNQRYRMYF